MRTRDMVRSYIRDNHAFGAAALPDDSASLLELGIIDSTGVLDLVSFLEAELDIQIRDDEMVPENLDSIDAVTAFVARKRAAAPVAAPPVAVLTDLPAATSAAPETGPEAA